VPVGDVRIQDLTSSLDCAGRSAGDYDDASIVGNSLHFDVDEGYGRSLCNPQSPEYAAFVSAFQAQMAQSLNDKDASLHLRPEDIVVDEESMLSQQHCNEVSAAPPERTASAPAGNGGTSPEEDGDSSTFDAVAVLLVLVGCGAGYRHVKNRPPKYQAVSLDEEIPLNDFSIDAPGRSEDGDGMLARRDNPSYGAGRPGAGKAR